MNARLSKLFRFARVAFRAPSQSKALRASVLVRRVLAALLVLALVLPGGLFSPQPAAAQARGALGGFLELTSVFFSEGGRTFVGGEVVTITGAIPFIGFCPGMLTGFPPKGRGEGRFDPFPTADFYVIKDTGGPLGFLQPLNDESGGVNRVIGLSSGAIVDEVVGITKPAGNLGEGRYDIVMDQCLDGHFDPFIDIVLGEGSQYAFEVVLPGTLPPISLHPIKEAAANYVRALDGETVNLPGGGQLVVPGFCKHFNDWEDSAVLDAASSLGIWTKVARNKCVDLTKRYKGIKGDPPDPNFTQFAELGPRDYHFAAAGTPLERAVRTLAGTLSEQAVTAQAILTTLERFQGAEIAGDHLYMILQLEELNKQINLLIGPGGSVLRFYAAMETFDLALGQDPLGQSAQAQALRAFFPEMRRGIGQLMTPLGPQFMRKLGTTQDTVVPIGLQAWIIVYLGLDPLLSTVGLPSIAQVRQFNGLPPLVFNHPNASTGGPYTAPPGTSIHFDASKSTDPNGDALAYAWDLDGDGEFDDGNTAAVDHSFAEAGTQLLGVKVADPAGNTDVAYTFARAGDVSSQDVIAASRREEMWRISPSGSITTLRPPLPALTDLVTLHVDVNGDIWVVRSPYFIVGSGLSLERYDSTGALLNTMTTQQVGSLVGFNIQHFRDFVLDGRGDIIVLAVESLGPGMREFLDFPQLNRFEFDIAGRMKVLRLAKDGSRASVIAEVDQNYYQALIINGQLVIRTFAADSGGSHLGSLSINPNGDIVVGHVNNLLWTGRGCGFFTMDPDSGAMSEVIPDNYRSDPFTSAPRRHVLPVFGGVYLGWGSMCGVGPVGRGGHGAGTEVDAQGNYIASGSSGLRMARIPIPPQISDGSSLGSPAKFIETFPLNVFLAGAPSLFPEDIVVDSGGDVLAAGTEQNGIFAPGIFRITPDGQVFQMAVTPPGPMVADQPSLLDVVPTIRNVTAKDIPLPLSSVKLSGLDVNQQGCPGDVTISATLTNTGSQPLTAATHVLFWDGDPGAGGVLIGSADVNPPLAAGGSALASFTWANPPAGTGTIFVTVPGSNTLSRALFVCVPSPAAGSDSIVLAPATAAASVGSQHSVTATMLDIYGRPMAGAPIEFQVTGANSANGTATTDANGVATFQYNGTNPGSDVVFANFLGATSNDATMDWTTGSSDTTPPVLALPANITTEATGPAGAVVNFSATANDNVDGSVPVTCGPASGTTFALGATTVDCSASDSAGNSSTGSFSVIVQDTSPPVLTPPANITVEATSPSGAAVNYVATANDAVYGAITPVCSLASGSTFPLGHATVNCTATDAANNQASSFFDVFVVDTTPPTLSPHANLNVPATSASGAAVNYTAPTASDIADANPTVACAPASGSTFPLGTTTVNCTATDLSGNPATSFFDVFVQVGTPRIAGTLVARGSDALGNRYFEVRLTNTGTGHARNLKITQLLLRTLSGSGTVTHLSALSGALPLSIGSLDVSVSTTVRFYLSVPSTVTRFSITESGTVQNVVGTQFSFSTAQSVIP